MSRVDGVALMAKEWERHLVEHMSPETCETIVYLAAKKAGISTYLDLVGLVSRKSKELKELE